MRRPRWYEVLLPVSGLSAIFAAMTSVEHRTQAILAFGVVLVVAFVLYRRGVLSGLRNVGEAEFVEGCVTRVGAIPRDFLVKERARLASGLGVPSRVLGPDTNVVELMAAFGWFGLESMMLDAIHEYADEKLRGERPDVQAPVCQLIAAAWLATSPRPP